MLKITRLNIYRISEYIFIISKIKKYIYLILSKIKKI